MSQDDCPNVGDVLDAMDVRDTHSAALVERMRSAPEIVREMTETCRRERHGLMHWLRGTASAMAEAVGHFGMLDDNGGVQ